MKAIASPGTSGDWSGIRQIHENVVDAYGPWLVSPEAGGTDVGARRGPAGGKLSVAPELATTPQVGCIPLLSEQPFIFSHLGLDLDK
jgi:hypothetical protein